MIVHCDMYTNIGSGSEVQTAEQPQNEVRIVHYYQGKPDNLLLILKVHWSGTHTPVSGDHCDNNTMTLISQIHGSSSFIGRRCRLWFPSLGTGS